MKHTRVTIAALILTAVHGSGDRRPSRPRRAAHTPSRRERVDAGRDGDAKHDIGAEHDVADRRRGRPIRHGLAIWSTSPARALGASSSGRSAVSETIRQRPRMPARRAPANVRASRPRRP